MNQGMNSSGSNGLRTKSSPLNVAYALANGGGGIPGPLKGKIKNY